MTPIIRFNQARHSRALFLPMLRADADRVILQHRTALEAVRGGYADTALMCRRFTAILLTRYPTEDGRGLLDLSLLNEAEHMLTTALENGEDHGDWSSPPALIDLSPVSSSNTGETSDACVRQPR